MVGVTDPHRETRTRTFRLTARQRLESLVGVAPILVLPLVFPPDSVAVLLMQEVGLVLAWLAVSAAKWRVGVTLTAAGAAVGGLRARLVPWTAIQDVSTESLFGGRFVVLVQPTGRTRLPAPVTGLLQRDPEFEDKLAEIRAWWIAHRNPDWRPAERRAVAGPRQESIVLATRVWPAQAVTGVVALSGAGGVAAATWWPRQETTFGPVTVIGGRLADTAWFLAGAVVLGGVAGVLLGLRAAKRGLRPTRRTTTASVPPTRAILAVAAAGVGLSAVVGVQSWLRIDALVVPCLYIAGAITVGAACLVTLPWLYRLERRQTLPVETQGPFWIPPGMVGARSLLSDEAP